MLRDVFYFNKKPNVHARERHAKDLAQARLLSTTDHFWIVNEFCDYRNFDWDFDFEFLPDEEVWAENHTNVWPSQHQKDSGTWLCPKEHGDVTLYRADVPVVTRKNEDDHRWVLHDLIDKTKFDFSWHPDPMEQPYIYAWGSIWYPVELSVVLEYHTPGATEYKYMDYPVRLLPGNQWNEVQSINKDRFDMTWRPDPREPPFIYVWGNKWIDPELQPTLEYHVLGATDRKYMTQAIDVLSEKDRWNEVQPVDNSKFDMTWRPDPREPPFIYVWGNKYTPGEREATLEYHVPGATERKYIGNVELEPEWDRWIEVQPIDRSKFDLRWRPDPNLYEPPFIYVWGNKWVPAQLKSSLEYHAPGATERKYMEELVEVLPDDNWTVLIPTTAFDYSWRPDPREPPFIYVWGNKWVPAELQSTVEYVCPGASQKKYMSEIVDTLPDMTAWNIIEPVTGFDFTWRPDPTSPPYVYVFGNTQYPGTVMPTLEYTVAGSTERKYITDIIPILAPDRSLFKQLIPVDLFDFSWRPDPTSPPYIYVWGNQWNAGDVEPTLEFHVEGATAYKYITEQIAPVAPDKTLYKILHDVEVFDFSWRPDPTSPPYIYVWGNTQYPGTVMPTIEFHVPGATERKYMTDGAPTLTPDRSLFKQLIPVDLFDFSWRPDPTSPPYIYVWGNQWNAVDVEPTLELHVDGATEYKYMTDQVAYVSPDKKNYEIVLDLDTFDFSWRPDPREPPFIYVWGNNQYPGTVMPTVRYHCPGAMQEKHLTNLVATLAPRPDLFENVTENFDYSWRPDPTSPPYIYQFGTLLDEDDGPRFVVPGNDGSIVKMNRAEIILEEIVFARYKIETTLTDLILAHPGEIFWALNPDLDYSGFDFKWLPDEKNVYHINAFGSKDSINSQTYFVNGKMWARGYRDINYVEGKTVDLKTVIHMFYVDRGNPESNERFEQLKLRYGNIQKTRYLNSWVDTINRCINRSSTTLCWILNSELDYSNFEFDFYPSPWQMKMVHVFGTQWSHWGSTFMVNKENFAEETKYINIIEHLSILNFVRRKTAVATNRLYDIVLIDHGNKYELQSDLIILYNNSYLNTFRDMLKELPVRKDHYVWVCSSVCDYSSFDFSYICDPYAKDQLHVFPSDKQKFGDTFLIDVNKMRTLIADMSSMEDYEKINFNQHQKARRLPPPVIPVKADTHVGEITEDFEFPYAIYETESLNVIDPEPMNLWAPDTKSIIVTSTGGTRLVVPREAKQHVKNELYDYPYIKKATLLTKSAPMDIVFLSNGEAGAEENYEHLLRVTKGLPNRVVRVDGVTGRVAAYHAALNSSNTPWAFTVFAKLKVNEKFDWSWQPDRLQIPKHYIFSATNPVNGLEYGHQAMIAYNKKLVLGNTGQGLDFTLDNEHEVVELNSGVANFNTDEFSTWRTAFREAIKLRADTSEISEQRLNIWLSVGSSAFAQYSLQGAQDAVEYYESVNGDQDKLRLSYEWDWLRTRFNK